MYEYTLESISRQCNQYYLFIFYIFALSFHYCIYIDRPDTLHSWSIVMLYNTVTVQRKIIADSTGGHKNRLQAKIYLIAS